MGSAFTFFLLFIAPMLFTFYKEYITWSAGLDEAQAGIKTAGEISSLRCADDIPLMVESEKELKSLLRRVKRGE